MNWIYENGGYGIELFDNNYYFNGPPCVEERKADSLKLIGV